VSAEARDLLHAAAGDVRPARGRHDEGSFDLGVQLPVEVGHLQLVLEVGDRPQAFDDHFGTDLLGVVGQEAVEGVDLDAGDAVDDLFDEFDALGGAEQAAGLVGVVKHGYGQPVVDPGGSPDDVDVPVVQWIEAAWVDGVYHSPSLTPALPAAG